MLPARKKSSSRKRTEQVCYNPLQSFNFCGKSGEIYLSFFFCGKSLGEKWENKYYSPFLGHTNGRIMS